MGNKEERKIKLKENFKKIYEAEQNFGFFQFCCGPVPLWIYMRDRAINIASKITSYEGQSASFQKVNIFNLIKRIFYFLFNFYKIFNNDLIVFTNERHLELDSKSGAYYNPFAEFALGINKNCKKALIFEFPIPMTLKYKKISYKRYLPLDFFLCLKQFFSSLSVFYYRRVKKEFGPKFSLARLWEDSEIKKISKYGSYSAYNIKFYGALLKIIKFLNPKVKLIYSCMGGFDKFPGVIEIQPALITGYLSVYIYPQTSEIKNFLKNKKIIVFSQKTKELLALHGYHQENIMVTDNPKIRFYFLKNLSKDFFEEKVIFNNKVVIIGNWGGSFKKIFTDLVSDIEKNEAKLKEWDISLVLHPTEKNTYKNLGLKKVKVFENYQVSLWKMLSEAVCTINIASSVLEDSTYFGCFNIILEDKNFEDQKDYIELMCEDYIYQTIIPPEKFIDWFEKNKKTIESHISQKMEIMRRNYEHFLKTSC